MINNNQVLASVRWILIEKGFKLILGILVVSLLGRYLGVRTFGELNFLLSLLSVAIVFSSLGLNRILPREIAHAYSDESKLKELISTAFFLRLLVSLLLFLFLVVLSVTLSSLNQLYFLLVLASVLFSPFDVIDLHQQGMANVRPVAMIRSAVFFCSAALKLSLIYISADFFVFFVAVLLEHIFIGLGFFFYSAFKYGPGFIAWRATSLMKAKSFIKESWTEIFAALGGILFVRLDQIMLQFIKGSDAVGQYSAAVRISEAWYFIPAAIVSASFPKIAQLKQYDEKKYIGYIELLSSCVVMLAVFMSLVFVFFSDHMINYLFGSEYDMAANILKIHCFSAVFIFLGSVSGSWLAAEKNLIQNFYRNIVGLLMNVLLNIILIPAYGEMGAAIATLVAVIFAYYLYDLMSTQAKLMSRIKTQAILSLGLWGIICNINYIKRFLRGRRDV